MLFIILALSLIFLPRSLGSLTTVHFTKGSYAEGSFNVSKEFANISTLTECVSLKENAISFVKFDQQANTCTVGVVDLEYSGASSTAINLFSGKLAFIINFIIILIIHQMSPDAHIFCGVFCVPIHCF